MKKVLIFLILALFLVGTSATAGLGDLDEPAATATSEESTPEEKHGFCPITNHAESCFSCHTFPTNALREADPHYLYNYPGFATHFYRDKDRVLYAHYYLTDIDSEETHDFFEYVYRHPEIKKVVFDIHSGGGSVAEAWRIISQMNIAKSRGLTIETNIRGYGASAAFLVMVNGSKKHRLVSQRAMLMHHELWTIAWIKIETPSSTEDTAKILRFWQDNISEWLSERSKLTKKELTEMVHKKDFWMNGIQAYKKYGFADGFIE